MKLKRFKDFAKRNKGGGLGAPSWTINDVTDMLDYLASKIEKYINK